MEWENEEQRWSYGVKVKVMSDEQMEILRKQICVYATICEQLVEMHKAITAPAQQHLAGVRLGNNFHCDPLWMPSSSSSGHMITARQRWTPTPLQLQILERIFDQGNGTPTKHKIKHITIQLSQHGQISETNVYNWFQNRRARSKRKNHPSQPHSPKHKNIQLQPSPSPSSTPQSPQDIYFHTPDIGFDQLMSKIEVASCYGPYSQAEMLELSD